jgi:flotillin
MDLFSSAGLVILVLAVTLLLVFGMVASRYQKVAPNEVLVIAGRKHRIVEDGESRLIGHRVVKGGGTFVWPVLEKVSRLSLNAMTIDVSNEDAYTRDGVPVIVDSVVIMKIGGDDVPIASAAERFLGFKSEDIQKVAKEVLGGHLRAICSTLSPEEINNNRVAFQQKVLEVAHKDFQNMGLVIDSFTVRQIRDKQGYFDALGRKSTAEVKRNAIVGEAEALQRDAMQRESAARQAGQTTKAETEAMIAQANKERDVKIAQYEAQIAAEKAKASQSGPQAEAIAKQQVVAAETMLAEKQAERTERELLSSVVKPAEAKKRADIAKAEGEKQARVLAAEADQYETEQEGRGEAAKIKNIGEAEGIAARVKGEGEAAAIKAKLLAEAEGLERKAQAMKNFNDAGMGLEISKEIIRMLPELIKAATAPIAAVDSIKIIDVGGNGNGGNSPGSSPVERLLDISPRSLTVADETLKATLGKGLMEMLSLARTGKLNIEGEGVAAKVEAAVENLTKKRGPAKSE